MIILLRKRQLIDYYSPIRHRNSPKRKRRRLVEGKNSKKSEIRVEKMQDDHTFEEKIILQQLGRGTHPKKKRRRLLEGQELPKKRNGRNDPQKLTQKSQKQTGQKSEIKVINGEESAENSL